jgi:hypothetical protein
MDHSDAENDVEGLRPQRQVEDVALDDADHVRTAFIPRRGTHAAVRQIERDDPGAPVEGDLREPAGAAAGVEEKLAGNVGVFQNAVEKLLVVINRAVGKRLGGHPPLDVEAPPRPERAGGLTIEGNEPRNTVHNAIPVSPRADQSARRAVGSVGLEPAFAQRTLEQGDEFALHAVT